MKKLSFCLLLVALYSFSCSTTLHRVLDRLEQKTPHEAYADGLDDRGLAKTPEGRAWLAASQAAIGTPLPVALPYRLQGYFQPDKPRALGLAFAAKAGERLSFTLTQKDGGSLPLYADVFRPEQIASPVLSIDTGRNSFSLDVVESGTYLLRLQPALLTTGDYNLSIAVGPSLGFPVAGSKAAVGSVWGDDRDGGKRRHEGIDIFAPKLTPALAAADGYVTGLRNGGLGGKTVWIRPHEKNYTLYYAHLDKQLVQEGQEVKKGDVVGLVGNTGNAQHTPSHLHFGVYTAGGPINPLPFVDRSVKTAPAVAEKKLTNRLQLVKAQKGSDGLTRKAATPLVPLAADAGGYVVEAPDGGLLQVPFSDVKATGEAVARPGAVAVHQAEFLPKS